MVLDFSQSLTSPPFLIPKIEILRTSMINHYQVCSDDIHGVFFSRKKFRTENKCFINAPL